MAGPRKFLDLSEKEKEQFRSKVESFYLTDKKSGGLGRSFNEFEDDDSKHSDMFGVFFDKDGNTLLEEDQLFETLEAGKPVFAFKNCENTPCPVIYQPDSAFQLGDNVSSIQEPAKPGFLDKIKGYIFRMKDSLNKIKMYNEYLEKSNNAKIFLSVEKIQTREEYYLPDEEKRQKNADAENIQLMAEQKREKLENQKFRSSNLTDSKRWENVSFEQLCIELEKRMRINDITNYSDSDVNSKIEKFNEELNTEYGREEILKRGKNIFYHAVVTENMNILDAMVADIVEGTATDKQIKDLNRYLKLGTITEDQKRTILEDQTTSVYKNINFNKDAAINNDTPISSEIVFYAEQLASKRPVFDTVSKYLSLCAYKSEPVKMNSFGMQQYSDKKRSAIENIGLAVFKYQNAVGTVINGGQLTDNQCKDVRELQIIEATYGINIVGEPLPLYLLKSDDTTFIRTKQLGNTSQKERQFVGGKKILDEIVTSPVINDVFKKQGMDVNFDMENQDIAKHLTNKNFPEKREILTAISQMMEKRNITSKGKQINEVLISANSDNKSLDVGSEAKGKSSCFNIKN